MPSALLPLLPATVPVRVLMVCMGNICRSPTAHGVLQHKVAQAGLQQKIVVDSAGTHDYHVGDPPDARSQQHARRRGYDLSARRARYLGPGDFVAFDLILVMDADNEREVMQQCPRPLQYKIHRLAAFCRRHHEREVPDPYYGGAQGFERVLDLVEDACSGLLHQLEVALANH